MKTLVAACALLTVSVFLSPALANAQEEEEQQANVIDLTPSKVINNTLPVIEFPDPPKLELNGELQAWLDQNSPAPFAGVHVNPEGWALILSEYKAQKARGEAALERQRSADFAVLLLQTGRLEVELETTNKKSEIQQQASDNENKRLLNINKDLRADKSDFWGDVFKVGGGVGAGILIGAIITLVAGA